MKMLCLGIAATLAVSSAATPASALIVNIVYEGVVNRSLDETGVFGSIGTNTYVGMSYTARYTLDIPNGIHQTNPGPEAFERYYGGSLYGAASPVSAASVTVNGVTVAIPPIYEGQANAYNYDPIVGGNRQQSHIATDYVFNALTFRQFTVSSSVTDSNGGTPLPLTGPFEWHPLLTGGTGSSFASIFLFEYTTNTLFYQAEVYANVTRLVVSPAVTPGVPEPATWAMMLLGFGGLAVAANRRRNTVRTG